MSECGSTTTYRNGCRCTLCKRAAVSYNMARRLRGLDDPNDSKHGTTTGYSYGCRCERCSACYTAYNRQYRAARPGIDKHKNLRRNYGISLDTYEAMHETQGGVCAACRLPESRTRLGLILGLAVDHNHETGDVRGLLCGDCNVSLGLLREDPERMRALATYIEGYA